MMVFYLLCILIKVKKYKEFFFLVLHFFHFKSLPEMKVDISSIVRYDFDMGQ